MNFVALLAELVLCYLGPYLFGYRRKVATKEDPTEQKWGDYLSTYWTLMMLGVTSIELFFKICRLPTLTTFISAIPTTVQQNWDRMKEWMSYTNNQATDAELANVRLTQGLASSSSASNRGRRGQRT